MERCAESKRASSEHLEERQQTHSAIVVCAFRSGLKSS